MLAITLMFLLILLNDKYGFFNSLLEIMFNNGMGIMIISVIIIIILMIVLTHAIATVNPTNILASNSIWLCLIILTSLLLIPIIYLGRMTDVIGLAGILTVVIVIIVGLLGYYLGDKIITFDWDYYLHIALLILVVIIILGIFLIKTPEAMIKFIYIISIISLIIFVLLLLSNHKKLKDNSTKCIDGQVVPNYPLESWNIFLKIIIIFKNLIRILAIRKGKFRK
jgi:FtsH-binding integral membrane protein